MTGVWISRWLGIYICLLITLITTYKFYTYKIKSNFFYRHVSLQVKRDQPQIPTPKVFQQSKRQEKRLKHLKDFCVNNKKNYSLDRMLKFIKTPNWKKAHLYISHKKQVVYCGVPKIASTSWKKLMLLFEESVPNVTDIKQKDVIHRFPQVKLFSMISKEHRKHVLLNYYKFFFARHPFERLASVYRNKFTDNNRYFEQMYGSHILRLYRANLTNDEYIAGKNITFTEFVTWLIDKRVYEPHWVPVHKLCHPCILPYDFIGKMETLVSDSKEVLQNMGAPEIHFPSKIDYASSTRDIMYKYFSQLPPVTINQLYKLYEVDFLAFGYKVPEELYHGQKQHV